MVHTVQRRQDMLNAAFDVGAGAAERDAQPIT